jgi:CheY-like chemotaxis protein
MRRSSAREALEHLLKTNIAVILSDVRMPEVDGFELAAMIRDHPRFETTAMIFVSAIALTDIDRLRGYEHGAVDYLPVPVVPELLRAKVRIFADLYRKTDGRTRADERRPRTPRRGAHPRARDGDGAGQRDAKARKPGSADRRCGARFQ